MPLSDVVQRAADHLSQAADRLERGMSQFGQQAARVGQAAAETPAQAQLRRWNLRPVPPQPPGTLPQSALTPPGWPNVPAPTPVVPRALPTQLAPPGTPSLPVPTRPAARPTQLAPAGMRPLLVPAPIPFALPPDALAPNLWDRVRAGIAPVVPLLGQLATGLGAAIYAGKRFSDFFLGLAAKASPNTMATFRGSWDLLEARVGRLFVPAVEAASSALQDFAEAARNMPQFALDYARRTPANLRAIQQEHGVLGYTPLGAAAAAGRSLLQGMGFLPEPAGLAARLRSAQGMGGVTGPLTVEESLRRTAAAGALGGTLEAEIERSQLETLQSILGSLQRIEAGGGNFAGLRAFLPSYTGH